MKDAVIMATLSVTLVAVCGHAEDANTEPEVLSSVVVVIPTTATKTSVVKSPTVVTTEMGDVTVEPKSTTHYDVSFRVARGPIQHARLAGDKTVQKVKDLEYVANQKKQVFSVISIVKAAH